MNPQEKLFNTVAGPMGWIPPTVEIDWESRRWQAAVAAMNAFAIKHIDFGSMEKMAACSVNYADALIAEYRKTEAK